MSAVSEISNRQVDSVSMLVDPFRTTFVFRTFSSGMFYRYRELPAGFTGGERFDVLYVRGGGEGMGSVSVLVVFF